MIPQTNPSPSPRPALSSHFHINGDTCPWCKQVIPPDKLEEISGKIALREREQSLAITAKLEHQFGIERAQADAAAKVNLELERRQGAAREAAAREQAQKAAEAVAAEQLAAAEHARQELQNALQTQVEQAETARKAAEQIGVSLQAQLELLRQENETALATAKAESKARETEIRTEAQQAAKSAMAEKLTASESARAAAEATLQVKVTEAEAMAIEAEQKGAALQEQLTALQLAKDAEVTKLKEDAAAEAIRIRQEAIVAAELLMADKLAVSETARLAAEATLQAKITEADAIAVEAAQKGAALQEQLIALQQAKDAEVTKLKEDAAAEAIRIRQEATAAAEVLMADKLAANERAATEATAKAQEAEERLATLATQHESIMNEQLTAQREVLEKAKEAELNAVKAKAFEESQKQLDKLNEMQRALEKKTNAELGEGAEINLYEALRAEFPDDRITHIGKGVRGADVLHVVVLNGKDCGTIIYDSKNHGQYRSAHVAKLRSDQLAAKAEHAILSIRQFPAKTSQLHIEDGVLLANPARVVAVVTLIRLHMIETHTLRMSGAERESKTALLYDFITSDRYRQFFARVDANAEELLELQVKQKKFLDAVWKKEGELIKQIQKTQGDLSNEISCIIGAAADAELAFEEVQL